MTHRHRRPLVLLPSSFGRWVVVGFAGTHTPYIGGERLQNKPHGYHTGPSVISRSVPVMRCRETWGQESGGLSLWPPDVGFSPTADYAAVMK
jgi:hypothetical protein